MKASEHGVQDSGIGTFAWSHDEERFQGKFSTIEEALAEGREEYPDHTIYVGEVVEVDIDGCDADDVIERLALSAYDQCGEFAEDYLDHHSVTKEARAELDAELERVTAAWLTKHGLWPSFYAIGKVEAFPAPEPATK